jgi:hypothetical protein
MANAQNLKPYAKGQTGNPQGRPKKIFSAIAAELMERGHEPATPRAVKEAFEILLALPYSELEEIAGGKDRDNGYPALFRVAAGELLGERGFQAVVSLLDRAHGKPMQRQEISEPPAPPMFAISKAKQEDLEALLDALDALDAIHGE